MFDYYLKKLADLRTDKNRSNWTGLTCHQAPHKPFLLLSVMDHFAQGLITENFVEPSFDLVDTFNIYWSGIMPLGTKGNMAYPFPRLQNDGIWQLIPKNRNINIEAISTMKKLNELCAGAKLDDELFKYLCAPDKREQLRSVIIHTYFDPAVQTEVNHCGKVNVKSFNYSREIMEVGETKGVFELVDKKVRDQGFRRAIVSLYEHRCALCGIRMLTPEGHTVVEAAHIVPWKDSKDDRPTNGMSLCRLCHWSFDEGLMSVGKNYEVLVSKNVKQERNYPGHIFTLSGRSIFKPDEKKFWPAQENLDKHRKKVYSG